ncbi:hypothetical protein CCMA1212_004193 [Trichoderma ghanense]|uniref:Uncharacterized protein n=1 Tax=Trichoderma ghanense TaxID=65468 RepID=A0ABY2H4L0_9HYPO
MAQAQKATTQAKALFISSQSPISYTFLVSTPHTHTHAHTYYTQQTEEPCSRSRSPSRLFLFLPEYGTHPNIHTVSRTSVRTSPSHATIKMIESCSKPTNFGRGAYDTTGLPKPPPPQPQ